MSRPNLFNLIGPDRLRAVVVDFYQRVFDDVMIGFMFVGKNRQHLIEREYEFTAHFLGGPVVYTGRPIKEAHAKTPIFGGHFERRLQILRNTLADHSIDAEVVASIVEHQQALRAMVTGDKGSECKDTLVVEQAAAITASAQAAAAAGATADLAAGAIDRSASANPNPMIKLGKRKTGA